MNAEEGHLTLLGLEREESVWKRFLEEGLWILKVNINYMNKIREEG